jgi:hypothetical protein
MSQLAFAELLFNVGVLLPTRHRFSAGPVALPLRMTGPTLAGLFPLGWVGEAVVMVVVSLDRLVSPPPTRLDRFLGRLGRYQAVTAVADQILPPGLDECLPHVEPVLRLEELHQGPLHLPVPHVLGDLDRLLGKRVDTHEVKCCGAI